ncbi:hypothetical protein I9W82_005363 [Candida metapsilosis]|uniref:Uncharacterized protein n=1 Tax=Candida metapsilosis TaxID=273372 RepID=A0A8H8DA20_9ASCO|nr:hypothetical protein I9W82_005363 [Candida metapsilosis]
MSSANKVFINNSQFEALFDLKPNVQISSIIENFKSGDQCFLECPLQFPVKPTNNITININNSKNTKGVLDFLFTDQPETFYTASTNFNQPVRLVNRIINIGNININNYYPNQKSNNENYAEDARESISRHHSSKDMANVGSPNDKYTFSPDYRFPPVIRNLDGVEKRLQSLFVPTVQEDSTVEEQEDTRRVSCFHPISHLRNNRSGKLYKRREEYKGYEADLSGSCEDSDVSCFIPMVNNEKDNSTKNDKGVEKVLHKSAKTEEKQKTLQHTKNEEHKTRSSEHDFAGRKLDEECSQEQPEEEKPVVPAPVSQNRAEMLFGPQQDERYATQNYKQYEENEVYEEQGEERRYISFSEYEEMLKGYGMGYSSIIQFDEFMNYGASVREDPHFSISPEEYEFESTFEESEYDRVKSQDESQSEEDEEVAEDEEDEEDEQAEQVEQPEQDEQPEEVAEVEQQEVEEDEQPEAEEQVPPQEIELEEVEAAHELESAAAEPSDGIQPEEVMQEETEEREASEVSRPPRQRRRMPEEPVVPKKRFKLTRYPEFMNYKTQEPMMTHIMKKFYWHFIPYPEDSVKAEDERPVSTVVKDDAYYARYMQELLHSCDPNKYDAVVPGQELDIDEVSKRFKAYQEPIWGRTEDREAVKDENKFNRGFKKMFKRTRT